MSKSSVSSSPNARSRFLLSLFHVFLRVKCAWVAQSRVIYVLRRFGGYCWEPLHLTGRSRLSTGLQKYCVFMCFFARRTPCVFSLKSLRSAQTCDFVETKRVFTVSGVAFACVFTCNLHAMLQNACILRVLPLLGSPHFPPESPQLLNNFLSAGALKCDTDPSKRRAF